MSLPRRTLAAIAVFAVSTAWLLSSRRPADGQQAGPLVAPARRGPDAGPDATLDAGVDATDGGADAVARTCPADMVLVEGDMCITVDQRCLRWVDPVTQMQCAEFEPPKCSGRRRHVAVCIDRYEYPNRAGVNPVVSVSWYEARRLCTAQGKRLCTETEWTFSCEGETFQPYPYGTRRDRTACRIDFQPFAPDHARLRDPRTAVDEAARLYGAVPSGTMPRCVSPMGVHDMTGNVDEWVVNEDGVPFDSALKGGWWGPIRARCRPATIAHNEGFIFYQIGFRCCADPDPPYGPRDGGVDASSASPASPTSRPPAAR